MSEDHKTRVQMENTNRQHDEDTRRSNGGKPIPDGGRVDEGKAKTISKAVDIVRVREIGKYLNSRGSHPAEGEAPLSNPMGSDKAAEKLANKIENKLGQ